jgi:hypothetical protein
LNVSTAKFAKRDVGAGNEGRSGAVLTKPFDEEYLLEACGAISAPSVSWPFDFSQDFLIDAWETQAFLWVSLRSLD